MSQHDFDIANQTAPNTRADLNLALKALASLSSGVSSPSTTYANMLYYSTADNTLYKRNEADSAWISMGTVDEVNGFTPSNTTEDVGVGAEQTWKTVTRLNNTSYQNTSGKPIKVSAYFNPSSSFSPAELFLQVSDDNSTWITVSAVTLTTASNYGTVSEIIPNNYYYRYSHSLVSGTLYARELS